MVQERMGSEHLLGRVLWLFLGGIVVQGRDGLYARCVEEVEVRILGIGMALFHLHSIRILGASVQQYRVSTDLGHAIKERERGETHLSPSQDLTD
jgi:hypothetical protein